MEIRLPDPPVVNENGTLKIPAKIVVAAFLAALAEMWVWRIGTEGDRHRIEANREARLKLADRVDQNDGQINNLWKAVSAISPEDWKERLRLIEKWRIEHVEKHSQK